MYVYTQKKTKKQERKIVRALHYSEQVVTFCVDICKNIYVYVYTRICMCIHKKKKHERRAVRVFRWKKKVFEKQYAPPPITKKRSVTSIGAFLAFKCDSNPWKRAVFFF